MISISYQPQEIIGRYWSIEVPEILFCARGAPRRGNPSNDQQVREDLAIVRVHSHPLLAYKFGLSEGVVRPLILERREHGVVREHTDDSDKSNYDTHDRD